MQAEQLSDSKAGKRRRAPQALVISTFPPRRCGIGSYATQEVIALRRKGFVVHTCTLFPDGSATYRLTLGSISGIIRLMISLLVAPLDRIRLHYVDEFLPTGDRQPFAFALMVCQAALWAYLAVRAPGRFSITVHEVVHGRGRRRMFLWSRAVLFAVASSIEMHTGVEREAFRRWAPRAASKTVVVSHVRNFQRRFNGGQLAARRQLGLAPDRRVFLCIGFLQAHKGFDAAINAFGRANTENADLFIVGSVRQDKPAIKAHRDHLRQLAEATDNVRMIERFVDDEEFDAWICAADLVVVPYIEIWTSGVLARAMLYGRPVAMRDHATLREQAAEHDIASFSTDQDLERIFATARRLKNNDERATAALSRRPRVLVVAPLYGASAAGGAERVIAQFCTLLQRRHDVEVWSTRSSRLEPRDNALTDEIDTPQFRLRRFPTNIETEGAFRKVHRRVAQGLPGWRSQHRWARVSIQGIGMVDALKSESHRFDVIFLPHYFYGSTHMCAPIAPEKTILHPFLHDEPALRTRVISRLFGAPALVTLNSEAERIAAQRSMCFPVFDSRVIGNVVAGPGPKTDLIVAPLSLASSGIERGEPYLLYVGRLISEKNVELLIKWFGEARPNWSQRVRLVLVGQGSLDPAVLNQPDVVVLPEVSEDEKWRLMAHSLAHVQLSVLESFSLVTLETWLADRPVIVHLACDATTLHVRACNGGFAVGDLAGFAQAVADLLKDPTLGAKLGAAGRAYVETSFSEDAVQSRLENAIDWVLLDAAPSPPTIRVAHETTALDATFHGQGRSIAQPLADA
jgi:glycosyltransferase involved in cell wall biosynthesis